MASKCMCSSISIENKNFEMNEMMKSLILVLSNVKIGFLGAGRMSQALSRSLIERNVVSSKDQIIASDVDENQRKSVAVSQ
jgi:hypothetical protein